MMNNTTVSGDMFCFVFTKHASAFGMIVKQSVVNIQKKANRCLDAKFIFLRKTKTLSFI